MMGIPLHRLGRVRLHPRRRQGARQARDARPRDPHPRLLLVQRDRVQGARRRAGAAGDRGAPAVPDRRQAGRARARRSGSSSRARRPTSRRRWSRRSPTTARCCSSATSRAATSPSRCSTTAASRARCRSSRRCPSEEDFYDFEARYEIGRTRFVCPAELDDALAERAQRARARGLRAARLPGVRARRPDARCPRAASCSCSRPTRSRG